MPAMRTVRSRLSQFQWMTACIKAGVFLVLAVRLLMWAEAEKPTRFAVYWQVARGTKR